MRLTISQRLMIALAVGAVAAGMMGCNSYAPNAGHEIVLIEKPILFGHGGVDPTPIKTGRTYAAISTEGIEEFKVQSGAYSAECAYKLAVLFSNVVYPAVAAAAAGSPQIGQPAPDFTAVDSMGNSLQLSPYRVKTVVLDWTNAACT